MRFFKTLLGIILCIFAFAWSITAIAEKQALWLIGTGVCTALAVLLFRKTKKEKAKAAAKPQKPARGRFQHAAGLPIPEGMLCDLSLDESGLTVSSAGNNYTIAFEKITSVSAKTDVEVQKHIVSSAGGALVGAALFGVPGALIGGRAKTKQTATYKTFLVITYNNESGPTFCCLASPLLDPLPLLSNTITRTPKTVKRKRWRCDPGKKCRCVCQVFKPPARRAKH